MIFWGATFQIGKKLLRDMKKVYVEFQLRTTVKQSFKQKGLKSLT